MDLLVTGGRFLDGARRDILIEGGRIAAVGSFPRAGAAEVIDATGLVVMPGLADGHRHVWQAALRGLGADMTLPAYLDEVLGRIAPALDAGDARLATLLGAAEALDAGITTVLDFSNVISSPEHNDAVLDAYATAGIRAVLGHGAIPATAGLVTPAIAVFADPPRQIRLARDEGVIATVHAAGGGDQIRRFRDAGLLGPHLHVVHVNAMTPGEAKLLAETGTGVTVTPVVEATMGHGRSPWSTFAAAGGRAGLGTDVMVNAPSDLFEPLRDTLRSHRMDTGSMHPAGDLLTTITSDSARAIGLGGVTGVIEPGRAADLVLLDGFAHLPGDTGVTGAVVTTAGVRDVRTVIVNGRVVKRDGELIGLDLRELRRANTERFARFFP
ncbi:TRZ/ATZ family hydrolase [Actinoplanes italicus]|uniref:Cytosine/adenosine deaminase-related metal-dependent hydrolase n=1 Tax=Actinoplanes italicus TaxID=113567 RepID=A0A2T0KH67_9ACTN|nr:amidohydrolase family protein [Actinoplanes italicus]PRX22577.1 cytosine/adenosine deaminase-related metal-dependent hydrolase [Actinoplanes italicus]GIE28095.1 TRZ/ATZ family hydrolase [Actinoplanes italicus]